MRSIEGGRGKREIGLRCYGQMRIGLKMYEQTCLAWFKVSGKRRRERREERFFGLVVIDKLVTLSIHSATLLSRPLELYIHYSVGTSSISSVVAELERIELSSSISRYPSSFK